MTKNNLGKVAVAIDNSYNRLYELMLMGYDTVQWLAAYESPDACALCQEIENMYNQQGGVSLPAFLGFSVVRHTKANPDGSVSPEINANGLEVVDYVKQVEIYRNAPIYNHAHVGCRCALLVTRKAPVPQEYMGPSFSPHFITIRG